MSFRFESFQSAVTANETHFPVHACTINLLQPVKVEPMRFKTREKEIRDKERRDKKIMEISTCIQL